MNAETQQNPYAPPETRVSDFVEAAAAVEQAGRGIRLGAAVIDWILYLLAFSPLLVVALANGYDPAELPAELASAAGLTSLLLVAVLAVVMLVLVRRNGQTVGKKIVGIRVLRNGRTQAARAARGDGRRAVARAYFYGEMYRQRGEAGDEERAAEAYRRSIAPGAPPPGAYRNLGYLYPKLGDAAAAQENFRRYLEAVPDADDRAMIEFYLEDETT